MTTDDLPSPGPVAASAAASRWWPVVLLGLAVVVGLHVKLHRPASLAPLQIAAEQMRSGHLPLWDSSTGFGEPLLARGRLAVFSPTAIPLLRIPSTKVALPWAWAWPVREIPRLLLAGFGAALVVRRWGGRGAMPSLIGGIYILCGATLAQFRDTAVEAWAWLPWCVLAIAWLTDAVRSTRIVAAAIIFAFALVSADLVSSIALLCAVVGFMAGQLRRPGALRAVPAAAFAILLGLGLSAIVWLPWWDGRGSPMTSSPMKAPASAWFVRNYQWLPTRQEAQKKVTEPGFDPKAIVLLDEQTSPDWSETVAHLRENPPATQPGKFAFFGGRRGEIPIRITDTTPGHWRLELPDEDGWIVIAQTYSPDWAGSVVVNSRFGRSSRDKLTLPADGGLIAVPTHGNGAGELQLDYRPTAWRRGAIVSGATAALCCLLLGCSALGRAKSAATLPDGMNGLTYAAAPV